MKRKLIDHHEEYLQSNMLAESAIAYLPVHRHGNMQNARTASDSSKRTIALLGLTFGKPQNQIQSEYDYIDLIREGLPKNALDNIIDMAGFTTTEIAQIMHTSDRTLRRYTPGQKLDAEQSERVLELARLYCRGEAVFGTMELFKKWMDREVIALGEKKPKTFLDTSLGIEMLMDELGRIEHGVFA